MIAVEPHVSNFKTRFSEFAEVSDEAVSTILSEADELLGERWDDDDRTEAIDLWAAHTLALEEDECALEFALSGSGCDRFQSDEGEAVYRMTPYGARFYELLVRNTDHVGRSFMPDMLTCDEEGRFE